MCQVFDVMQLVNWENQAFGPVNLQIITSPLEHTIGPLLRGNMVLEDITKPIKAILKCGNKVSSNL